MVLWIFRWFYNSESGTVLTFLIGKHAAVGFCTEPLMVPLDGQQMVLYFPLFLRFLCRTKQQQKNPSPRVLMKINERVLNEHHSYNGVDLSKTLSCMVLCKNLRDVKHGQLKDVEWI